MDEYIRREDAIKCIEGQCVDGKMWGNDESEGTLIEAYSAIDDLMDIPAADVALVRHGRWEMRGGKRYCTSCGERACVTRDSEDFWYTVGTPYCPNCGAKMDLEDEDHG